VKAVRVRPGSSVYDPRLAWFVYIARTRREAIYRLYDERSIDTDAFEHLVKHGLLPEWSDRVADAERLVLRETETLASLAVDRGVDFARRRFIDAFLSEPENPRMRREVSLRALRWAVPAMTDEELERVIPTLASGRFHFDPRQVSGLLLTGRFDDRRTELLSLIVENGYPDRSMSSYFFDGTALGHEPYVQMMLSDLADNAKTYTHWYCAACYVALLTEGVVGAPLLEAVRAGRHVTAERAGSEFVLSVDADGSR
jgi:hypothetical protein